MEKGSQVIFTMASCKAFLSQSNNIMKELFEDILMRLWSLSCC